MTAQYLTKEGLEKLEKELDYLKKEKMPEIIERIARAKELGDLSENAEYQDAKDQQGFTAGRIVELEQLIRKAEIIEGGSDSSIVELGDSLTVKSELGEQSFTITGSNEADPSKGFISNESPLGRAFLGKSVGDKVIVQIPKGEMEYEIIKVG